MTRQELIDYIDTQIYPNLNNEVGAQMVREALYAMIDYLGGAATRDVGAVALNDDGLVTGDAVYRYVDARVTTLLKWLGVSSTPITDGGTEVPTIGGVQVTPQKADVVLYNGKEFVWTGSAWEELGDETSWALKTLTITAGAGLTGGGDLSQNMTIAIDTATLTKIDDGETAYGWGDHRQAGYVTKTALASKGSTSLPVYFDANGDAQTITALTVSGNITSSNGALNITGLSTLAGGVKLTNTKRIWFGDIYYLELDSSNRLHTNAPFYSDNQVASGGYSGGSTPSGVDLAAVWNSLTNAVADQWASTKIAAAHIPVATSSAVGGVQIGYTESGKNYAVKLSSNKAYVYVPWENTTYTAGTGITISSGNEISVTANTYAPYSHTHTASQVTDLSLSDGVITIGTGNTITPVTDVAVGGSGHTTQLGITAGGSISYITVPYATSTSSLDVRTISTESSITESNIRAYFGSGGSWTGSISTMAYAAILAFGSPSRGWQMWASRSGSGSGMFWRRGLDDMTGWDSQRLFLDDANYSSVLGNAYHPKNGGNLSMEASSFKLYGGTPTLTWDANASAWHLSGNFYADGFISAGGLSSGGGTSGIDEAAMWNLLANADTTHKISDAHLPALIGNNGLSLSYTTTGSNPVVSVGVSNASALKSALAISTSDVSGISNYALTSSLGFGTAGSDYIPITLNSVTKNVLTAHQSLAAYATTASLGSMAYESTANYMAYGYTGVSQTNTIDLNNEGSDYTGRTKQVAWGIAESAYVTNSPSTNTAASVLVFPNRWGGLQLYVNYQSASYALRNRYVNTGWTSWVFLYHSGNLTKAAVTGIIGSTILEEDNYTSYTPILNSASTHATKSSIIYAPSTAGTSGDLLTSNGSGAPSWTAQNNIAAGSATNDSAGNNISTYYLPLSAGSGKPLTGDLYMGNNAISGLNHINGVLYMRTGAVGIEGTPDYATFQVAGRIMSRASGGGQLVLSNTGVNSAAGSILFQSRAVSDESNTQNGFKISSELATYASRQNLYFYSSDNSTSPYAPNWFAAMTITYQGNVSCGRDLYVAGNFNASGQVAGGSASDARLKNNIEAMTADRARRVIMESRPVTFIWNAKAKTLLNTLDGEDIGLLAQEARYVLPQAVAPIWGEYYKIDYTKYVSPIIRVLQDHEERITELEKRMN